MVDPRFEPPRAVTVTVCGGGASRSSWLDENVSVVGDSAMPEGAGVPPPPPPPPPQPPAKTSTSPKTRLTSGPLPRIAMESPSSRARARLDRAKDYRQRRGIADAHSRRFIGKILMGVAF